MFSNASERGKVMKFMFGLGGVCCEGATCCEGEPCIDVTMSGALCMAIEVPDGLTSAFDDEGRPVRVAETMRFALAVINDGEQCCDWRAVMTGLAACDYVASQLGIAELARQFIMHVINEHEAGPSAYIVERISVRQGPAFRAVHRLELRWCDACNCNACEWHAVVDGTTYCVMCGNKFDRS